MAGSGENTRTCPTCGKAVSVHLVRCDGCWNLIPAPPDRQGAGLGGVFGFPAVAADGASAMDQPQPCPACGRELPTAALTCPACAHAVAVQSFPPVQPQPRPGPEAATPIRASDPQPQQPPKPTAPASRAETPFDKLAKWMFYIFIVPFLVLGAGAWLVNNFVGRDTPAARQAAVSLPVAPAPDAREPAPPEPPLVGRRMLIARDKCPGTFSKQLAVSHGLREGAAIVGRTGARFEALPAGTDVEIVSVLETFVWEVRILSGPHARRLFYVTQMCLETPQQAATRDARRATCTPEEWNTFLEIAPLVLCIELQDHTLGGDDGRRLAIRRLGMDPVRANNVYEKVNYQCGGIEDRRVEERSERICPDAWR